MVLENEAERSRPEGTPPKTPAVDPKRSNDQDQIFNIGFRHNPSQDLRADVRSPHAPEPGEQQGANPVRIQEANFQLLSSALGAQLGLSPAGAHIVAQVLHRGSADSSYTKSEVGRLLRSCADQLEEPGFVAGLLRSSGLSLEYVESARKTLSERAEALELAAMTESLQELKGTLQKHGVFAGDRLDRTIDALERDMKYGTCRGRACFTPEDSGRIRNLLEPASGFDPRLVNAIVQSVILEGLGKVEAGETQALIRQALEDSSKAKPAAVKAMLDVWISKSEQFDREDVGSLIFLVQERGSSLAAKTEAGRPSLYGHEARPVSGPLVDVVSLAGLDPAAERIARELTAAASIVRAANPEQPKIFTSHLLTNLSVEEWHSAVEQFRKGGAQPNKPGMAMTGDQFDLRQAVQVALTLAGVEDARVEPKKVAAGAAPKWRILYREE